MAIDAKSWHAKCRMNDTLPSTWKDSQICAPSQCYETLEYTNIFLCYLKWRKHKKGNIFSSGN